MCSLNPLWKFSVPKAFNENLILDRTLISSSRSVVSLAHNPLTNQEFVLKFSSSQGSLKKEASILSSLSHPNIVKLVKCYDLDEHCTCLVLEKAKGKSLIDILEEQGLLSEEECLTITKQLLSALTYLHSQGWLHRDIKPDNVIYCCETKTVTLIDFEMSCKLWNSVGPFKLKHRKERGTREYQAPEVLRGNYGGPQSDVWSLGATVYSLLTGQFIAPAEVLKKLSSTPSLFVKSFNSPPSSLKNVRKGFHLKRPPNVSSPCFDFLQRTIEPIIKLRVSLNEIENHPWISPQKLVICHSEIIINNVSNGCGLPLVGSYSHNSSFSFS